MPQPDELNVPIYTGREPFIFVSYARKNKDFVVQEIGRLYQAGYKFYIDVEDIPPGSKWAEEIYRNIEGCSCVLVFISYEAVESKNVWDEISHTLGIAQNLVCIYLEEIKWEQVRWEKIESDPSVRQQIREGYRQIQQLQGVLRYRLHLHEYERDLRRALSKYVGEPILRSVNSNEEVALQPVPAPPDSLPQVVYFVLILIAVGFFFFAVVVATMPFFAPLSPNDPLSNPLGAIAAGILLLVIAIGCGLAALVVHRKYLRRKND